MAKSRKPRKLSPGQHRRFRTQRILFTVFAVIIVASVLAGLLTTF